MIKLLQYKLEVDLYDENSLKQNELYLQSIPLDPGLFSDVGYRFRYNSFDKVDSVTPFNLLNNKQDFFDY